jgi:predicted nucleic acid-binding protein
MKTTVGGADEGRGRLEGGTARWCALVRLELWNGAGGEREKKVLREFERLVPDLAIDAATWNDACDLARRCRAAGVTVPATDILIAACARQHGEDLEHADGDFDAIARVPERGREDLRRHRATSEGHVLADRDSKAQTSVLCGYRVTDSRRLRAASLRSIS